MTEMGNVTLPGGWFKVIKNLKNLSMPLDIEQLLKKLELHLYFLSS